MSQIECGRGHLYDPDKYPVCPYCNTNQKITVAAAGRTAPISATEPQRTAPLSGVSAAAPLFFYRYGYYFVGAGTCVRCAVGFGLGDWGTDFPAWRRF